MRNNFILVSISAAIISFVIVMPTTLSDIQAQNNTNSTSFGGNMTNSTGSNATSTLNNPTGSNPPGMSQGQGGPNPTGSNIPCVAGNKCL
jgi:hypothetical protein